MKSIINVRGVSLVELLTSLVILSLLAGGLHQFHAIMLKSVALLETASEAQEGVFIAIELMQRDLRSAGFSRDGSLQTGIRQADIDSVKVVRDLNGDHDTRDANERVAYHFDSEGRRLMRQMGNAAPQPMLNDLAEEGLAFSFFTNEGDRLDPADGPLSDEDRSRLGRIDIDLSVELPHPYHPERGMIRCQQTSTVSLRNER